MTDMEAQRQMESLYRQLYAAEQLVEELERQRDQARGLAMAYLDQVQLNPRERYNLREWRSGRPGESRFYDNIPDPGQVTA